MSSMRGMNYLVTGGAGFIGSHLIEALMARGNCVTVLDDFSSGNTRITGATYIHADISRPDDIKKNEHLFQWAEVVFHLAAMVGVKRCFSSPLRAYEVNVIGSHLILERCLKFSKPMLYASSSSVFGKLKERCKENGDVLYGDLGNPSWSYALHKAVGENMARVNGFTAARIFNTVGTRQKAELGFVLPRFIQLAIQGKPITVYGDGLQTRSFSDVRDTVAGLITVADKGGKGEVYNIGVVSEHTMINLANIVYNVLDIEERLRKIEYIPLDKAIGPDYEETRKRAVDSSKLAALGHVPKYSLEETIRWIAKEEYDYAIK